MAARTAPPEPGWVEVLAVTESTDTTWLEEHSKKQTEHISKDTIFAASATAGTSTKPARLHSLSHRAHHRPGLWTVPQLSSVQGRRKQRGVGLSWRRSHRCSGFTHSALQGEAQLNFGPKCTPQRKTAAALNTTMFHRHTLSPSSTFSSLVSSLVSTFSSLLSSPE